MKLRNQTGAHVARYQKIALELLQDHEAGGNALSRTQVGLAKEFRVSRLTLRHALEWLQVQHPELAQVMKRNKPRAKGEAVMSVKASRVGLPIFADSFASLDPERLLASFWIAEAAGHELDKHGFVLDVQWVGSPLRPHMEKIERLCSLWDAVILEPLNCSGQIGNDHPFQPLLQKAAKIGMLQGGNHNCVYPDLYNGAHMVVAELMRLGASNILYTGTDKQLDPNHLARVIGAEKSLQNLPRPRLHFAGGRGDMESAYQSVRSYLTSKQPCDAIFGETGPASLGALRAVRDCGLRVPEDIQIISLGRVVFYHYLSPRFTMVAMPSGKDMGAAAARMAMALIRQKGRPQPNTVIPMTLIVGETTRNGAFSTYEQGFDNQPAYLSNFPSF